MSDRHILSLLRHKVDDSLAELRTARATRTAEREALAKVRGELLDCSEAQKVAQLVAQTVQQQAHERISAIVTRCLAAVFDEPYRFQIHFEQKRGRTEARLTFERKGVEFDPMSATGGGVVDVAAFALRLAALMLSRPALRRVLILDEPFKAVSEKYRERVCAMLERLSEEMSVQIIMVTHQTEFETGKIIRL